MRVLIKLAAVICAAVCVFFLPGAEGETGRPAVLVSLGDSYSSGEGNEPYYGQELPLAEKADLADWRAHRSESGWAAMLMIPGTGHPAAFYKDGPDGNGAGEAVWYFRAASGALIDHLYIPQYRPVKRGTVTRSGDEAMLESQLSVFDLIPENGTDWVTLTLGGNDAGFLDLLTICITDPGFAGGNTGEKIQALWLERKEALRDELTRAYRDIAARAGKRARIIVAGYPCLLSEKGDGLLFSKSEAQAVNEAVRQLNALIRECAEKCAAEGIRISFVSVEEEFAGHGAGDEEPYLYSFSFIPTREETVMPGICCRSMHPNADGQRAFARCVQREMDRLSGAEE